jgi:hypothetical protein
MKDPAGVHLEPADPGCGAAARQQADPGLVGGVPGIGQLHPGRRRIQAEGDRQVEQHHVLDMVRDALAKLPEPLRARSQ